MDQDIIFKKLNVSRETLSRLNQYKDLVLSENKKINLISSKSAENFIERHIIDCVQIIDFIDINSKTCTDLGSGAGLPGIALAILLSDRNADIKMNLYEKSYRKSNFLRFVSSELKLKTEIFQLDVFKTKKLSSGSVLSRAFKPLPLILDLVDKNFQKYTNLIIFMGKNGKEVLKNTFKDWDFEYKEKGSITSNDSFILNIKNIKKK
tara:strand:+ start:425 stop:1045 length:621 start_codon:yes stop_codon:yes gene_type:complete